MPDLEDPAQHLRAHVRMRGSDDGALVAEVTQGLVFALLPGPMEATEVPAGEAWRFDFPPGVTHAFENTGGGTQVRVALASQPHDPANPDTFRDRLLEPRQGQGPGSGPGGSPGAGAGAAQSTGFR